MQQKIFTTPSEQCTSLLIRDTQPARSIPAARHSPGSEFTATKRSARKAPRQPQTTLYGHRGFGEDGEPGEATPGACRWLRMGPLVCAVPPDTTRSCRAAPAPECPVGSGAVTNITHPQPVLTSSSFSQSCMTHMFTTSGRVFLYMYFFYCSKVSLFLRTEE